MARGFGDLSENSEYDEAKNEQGKLYSRIAELEEILQHVVIVDESNAPTNVVTIGCKVAGNGAAAARRCPRYRIVGSQEADPMHGVISEESPFGKALLGAKEGDDVTVEAPRGTIDYTVEKIERTKEKRLMAEQKTSSRPEPGAEPVRADPRSAGRSWPPFRPRGRIPSRSPGLTGTTPPHRSRTTSTPWRASL